MSSDIGRRFFSTVIHTIRDMEEPNMYEAYNDYTIDFTNPLIKDIIRRPIGLPAYATMVNAPYVAEWRREKRWTRGTISLDKQYNTVIVNAPILIKDWGVANKLVVNQFHEFCHGPAVHESPPPFTDEVGFLYLHGCPNTGAFFKRLSHWYPLSPE